MRVLSLAMLVVLSGAAHGQEPAPGAARASVGDEVIVRGRNGRNLRIEMERVEDAVYERFNALNSRDEFDIRCKEFAPLGTKIVQRECMPRFAVTAEGRASRDIVIGLQGSPYAGNPQTHFGRLRQKGEQLIEEMRRLAREDEELQRALLRLAELKQIDDSRRERDDDR